MGLERKLGWVNLDQGLAMIKTSPGRPFIPEAGLGILGSVFRQISSKRLLRRSAANLDLSH
jgi:hypothetical protein